MKKVITVFGSSKPVINDEQYTTAYNLGKQLAQGGFNVCTGGFYGIMEATSKGAVEGGAEAIGVTVNLWNGRANKYVTKEIVVPVTMTYLDESEQTKQRAPGDLLGVQATFNITLSEYDVENMVIGQKMAEDVKITVNIVGSSTM